MIPFGFAPGYDVFNVLSIVFKLKEETQVFYLM